MSSVTIPWNEIDLVKLYQDTSSGHFFDKDTMRFFNSRLTTNYRRLNEKQALFITTEQFDSNYRRYATVRMAQVEEYVRESDGRKCFRVIIETIGEFNKLNLHQAKKLMKEYIG